MDNYEFVVFKNPVEREIGNPSGGDVKIFELHESVFLPEKGAEHWIEEGDAVKNLWLCRVCSEEHYSLECPYKCSNDKCNNTRENFGFEPVHPIKHYEVAECLRNSFYFLTVEELRTTRGIGRIYVYDDGVYREDGTVAFIKRLTKDAVPRKRNTYRNEVCHHIADRTQISQKKLGLDGPKVAVANGILNLETLELEDFSPEKYALNKIPHEYNLEAECPKFKKALSDWIPLKKSRRRLQELLGTALHPEKLHKKMGFLLGPTDVGKSTFLEVIRYVFGKENTEAKTPHNLAGRWGTDKIFGILLNAADELDAGEINRLDILKAVADGNPIKAEEKGKKTYTFEPTCEHIFGANVVPDVDWTDEAFFNRIIPVEFPSRIPEDEQNPEFIGELKEEAEGILNWIIEGYRSFSDNGNEFTYPIKPGEAREVWFNWGNVTQVFIQEFVEEGTEEDKIHSQKLYHLVRTYASQRDVQDRPTSQKDVTKEFKKLPYAEHRRVQIDGRRAMGFSGMRVTYPEDNEVDSSYKNEKGVK